MERGYRPISFTPNHSILFSSFFSFFFLLYLLVTLTICVHFTFFLTTVAHTHVDTRSLIMPSKSAKKIQGPSLYKIFVDAYMKAHPNEKRAVSLLS